MRMEWRNGRAIEWVSLYGMKGRYEISDLGEIRNLRTGKIRRWQWNPQGYATVNLSLRNRKRRTYKISFLVLSSFYGTKTEFRKTAKKRPKGSLRAYHLNGCASDHRLSNLMWLTTSEIQKQNWQNGSTRFTERFHFQEGHRIQPPKDSRFPSERKAHTFCKGDSADLRSEKMSYI